MSKINKTLFIALILNATSLFAAEPPIGEHDYAIGDWFAQCPTEAAGVFKLAGANKEKPGFTMDYKEFSKVEKDFNALPSSKVVAEAKIKYKVALRANHALEQLTNRKKIKPAVANDYSSFLRAIENQTRRQYKNTNNNTLKNFLETKLLDISIIRRGMVPRDPSTLNALLKQSSSEIDRIKTDLDAASAKALADSDSTVIGSQMAAFMANPLFKNADQMNAGSSSKITNGTQESITMIRSYGGDKPLSVYFGDSGKVLGYQLTVKNSSNEPVVMSVNIDKDCKPYSVRLKNKGTTYFDMTAERCGMYQGDADAIKFCRMIYGADAGTIQPENPMESEVAP